MNLFQGVNSAASFLVFSALVAGMVKAFPQTNESILMYLWMNKALVYLFLFIAVFRIKTHLDDHKHFGESHQDKNYFRYVGFLLAIFSWIFLAIAAYLISSTIKASEMIALSLLISTSWIAVHVIEILFDKSRRETESFISVMREKWVLFNILYILCLVSHIGWLKPVIVPSSSTPLILLLVILAFDILTSRSFRGILSL